jgi:hypothetical protein
MKSLAYAGLGLIAAFSFTACDPKPKGRREPAPAGPTKPTKPEGPSNPTIDPSAGNPSVSTDPSGPEPTPRRAPEYGIKIEGKAGYVKSPYDAAGRPIDVRGLPPGTEVEDPYTPGRTLLVP